jgi:2-deoxy-D-gluconate 3-dehydrogenase
MNAGTEGTGAKPPILQRLFSLEGKVALITGASGGIGRVLAVTLAEAGAQIAVHGQDEARVQETCQLVREAGGKAVPLLANLYEVAACRKLVADTKSALGGLDILINNAATNRRKPIVEVTEEDFDFIVGVDLRSIFFLSQAAHPLLQERGGGKIIHISSINVHFALGTVSVYGASKGGVTQMTKAMAVEWAKDNIQVNSIIPGFIYTPLSRPIWADEYKANWIRSRIPLRRPAQPEELVGATLLLASPASTYITGQSIIVDGGFLAGGSWMPDQA